MQAYVPRRFLPLLNLNDEPAFERAGYWVPWQDLLVFELRGRRLREIRLPALVNVKPIPRIDGWTPPPLLLPKGAKAAVIPANPVDPGTRLGLRLFGKYLRYLSLFEERNFVKIEGTFEEYLDKFGGKARKNMRREVAVFRELCGGESTVRVFSSPDEMAQFQQIAVSISRKTYKAALGITFLEDQDFLEDTKEKARHGAVRGYVLYHGLQPVGYAFCRIQFENVHYMHIAHDPEYDRWSPGKVLLFLILESLFSEHRYRYLDFGGGEQWYKRFYGNHKLMCARILYVPLFSTLAPIVLGHYCFLALMRAASATIRKLRRIERENPD